MWLLSKLKPLFFGATVALITASRLIAADQPSICVVVPTLDAQFWNTYVTFMKRARESSGSNWPRSLLSLSFQLTVSLLSAPPSIVYRPGLRGPASLDPFWAVYLSV